MSAWGREDNIIIIANVTLTAGSTRMSNAHGNSQAASSANYDFVSNAFGNVAKSPTGGIMAGDYLVLPTNSALVDAGKPGNSPKVQIIQVNSSNVVTLASPSPVTANLVHPSIQQGPKYLANINSGTARVNRGNINGNGSNPGTRNVYSIQRVEGIDFHESNVTHNKHVFGIKTPGWIHKTSFKDRSGNKRHKTEQLVAMSKNAIEKSFDYPSEIHRFNIHFSFEPKNSGAGAAGGFGAIANVALANVRLVANAFTVPEGGTVAYRWLSKASSAATAFLDTPATGTGGRGDPAGISGNTTNVLFIANVSNVDGQVFICHATTTNEFGVIGAANSESVTVSVSS